MLTVIMLSTTNEYICTK